MNRFLTFLTLGVALSASPAFAAGESQTLYSQDFSSGNAMDGITVVDANEDGTVWHLDTFNKCLALGYNRFYDADDWAILPPISMVAGETYTITFDVDLTGFNNTERLEVKAGKTPEANAMSLRILAPFIFSSASSMTATFTPTEDGSYHIGFHGISNADQSMTRIDNITVSGVPGSQGTVVDPEIEIADLPYSQTFDGETFDSNITVVNSNNDFQVWVIQNQKAWLQYNSNLDSDDWLVLPPMRMKADNVYKVRFEAWAHQGNWFPEKFEVMYGSGPENMEFTILEPTVLTNKENEPVLFEQTFSPLSDGIYHIGFHGISDLDMDGLFLDNILVSEEALQVPSAATELTVDADPTGANKATISFNAPTIDLAGDELTALTRIDILRDEDVIKSFDNPQPGAPYTWTDETATRGIHTYHVVPYNEAGCGADAFVTLYVGVNVPAPVPSVTVAENFSKPGQVTLTWETPTEDVDGNPINPNLISYKVVERNGIYSQSEVKSGIRTNSYTYQAVAAGEEQQFKQWGVYAYTDAGYKHDTRTAPMAVGVPYETPYAESFANGEAASIVNIYYGTEETDWGGFTDDSGVGVLSQDGDNGFSGFTTDVPGHGASLTLGKVSLKDVADPGLAFYLYSFIGAAGANLDEVSVQVKADGTDWEDLFSITIDDLARTDNWNRIMVSLEEFAGKTIQLRFIAIAVNGGVMVIDNLYVGQLYKHNLGASSITLPAIVRPDTNFPVGINVANLGTEDMAADYEIELYRNGEKIATLPGAPVGVCDEVVVTFDDCVNAACDDVLYYEAAIVCAADECAADNRSRGASAEVMRSSMPAPRDLTATPVGHTVELSWTEPDLSELDDLTVTESFEFAESWAIDSVDGWTFIDGDDARTIAFDAVDFPGKNEKMAYQVFDRSSRPFAGEAGYDAKTGSKFLVSFCSASGANDDWAISPLLSGEEQTISFYASSFNVGGGYVYLESFEVLYSTTGTAAADFTRIGEPMVDIPAQWTFYSFDLPAGAKYFAIHCISEDKFIFMVDDVRFKPSIDPESLNIVGYNVYRNGERLNTQPVAGTTYTDTTAPTGQHTYVVTAQYAFEESGQSNLATANAISGIATLAGGISARVEDNMIVVKGAGKVTVADIAGHVLAASESADFRLGVVPGIYIVRADATVAKLIVR